MIFVSKAPPDFPTPHPQKRTLGCDPGIQGGWIVLDETGRITDGGNLPTRRATSGQEIDGHLFSQFLTYARPTVAYVEQVHSRPRQAGVFQFGETTGIILGVLMAHNVPIIRVSPQTWKATLGIRRGEASTAEVKNEARRRASDLFPDDAHLFQRVKDDGVAEAALIALYGIAHQDSLKGRPGD